MKSSGNVGKEANFVGSLDLSEMFDTSLWTSNAHWLQAHLSC